MSSRGPDRHAPTDVRPTGPTPPEPDGPFDVAARAPSPAPPPTPDQAGEPEVAEPARALGLDESWRVRRWLLDAALSQAREGRPDLSAEHFDSLVSEAVALLPASLFADALGAAYAEWLTARLAAGPIADDRYGEPKGWRQFYREVLATEGAPLVRHADPVAHAILVHIAARRRAPRRPARPSGRPPVDEARVRSEIGKALESLAARDVRRPTREQIAEEIGIGVRTLSHWVEHFPDVRRDLP